jgi:hypothetical protein
MVLSGSNDAGAAVVDRPLLIIISLYALASDLRACGARRQYPIKAVAMACGRAPPANRE